ncbi:hypothetical protein ANO11243_051110 [Dothideomycetidae sp. 11243]|nr:hypothetical protein ANO11243_051110 [fungal sp. No.11243]
MCPPETPGHHATESPVESSANSSTQNPSTLSSPTLTKSNSGDCHKTRSVLASATAAIIRGDAAVVKPRLGFLDLPQEIKLMVYNIVEEDHLKDDNFYCSRILLEEYPCELSWWDERPTYLPFAYTCREVFRVMIPRLYSGLTMHITLAADGESEKILGDSYVEAQKSPDPVLLDLLKDVVISLSCTRHAKRDLEAVMGYLEDYRALRTITVQFGDDWTLRQAQRIVKIWPSIVIRCGIMLRFSERELSECREPPWSIYDPLIGQSTRASNA